MNSLNLRYDPSIGYRGDWMEYLQRRFKYSMPPLELLKVPASSASAALDIVSATMSTQFGSLSVTVAAALL